MDEQMRAARIFAASAVALIQAMGMQAENDQRKAVGSSMAYTEDSFASLAGALTNDVETLRRS